MHKSKTLAAGTLITVSLIYSSLALCAGGSITLRDKDNAQCNLPVPAAGTSIRYKLDDDTPCKGWNDKARSFQINEMPSASTILIANSNICDTSDNEHSYPWFSLKTIKKQTSTSIIEIEYLATFKPNQIIEPGLQMINLKTSSSGNRDKISCITITTSAAPSSSTTTAP